MDYFELGATAVVAITAFKAIEYIVKILKPTKNDNKEEIDIAVLKTRMNSFETNHLVHQKAIEEALIKNNEEHKEIQVMLGKICIKLDIK